MKNLIINRDQQAIFDAIAKVEGPARERRFTCRPSELAGAYEPAAVLCHTLLCRLEKTEKVLDSWGVSSKKGKEGVRARLNSLPYGTGCIRIPSGYRYQYAYTSVVFEYHTGSWRFIRAERAASYPDTVVEAATLILPDETRERIRSFAIKQVEGCLGLKGFFY